MIQQLQIGRHPLYQLNPILSSIVLESIVALDTETRGLFAWKDAIRLIALKSGNDKYLIQPEFYTKDELTIFFKRVAECLVVCHGTKFDGGFIYCKYGVLFENLWCTQLGSQIYYGGNRKYRHNLDIVLEREIHVHIGDRENKREKQKSFTGEMEKTKRISKAELTPEQLAYAVQDVEHLLPLRETLIAKLATRGLGNIVKLENKLTPVLIEMEARGCLLDVEGWKQQLKEWEIKRSEILRNLDAEVRRIYPMMLFANVNYGSPKQVLGLFRDMKLPLPYTEERVENGGVIKKKGVGEDALTMYLTEYPDTKLSNFIKILLDYREYDKLLSTYGAKFLASVDKDNHVHTIYSQCSTDTHRMSSKAVNLQNIPSKKSGGEGVKVRKFFIAPVGYKMITCDMEAAEITIAADRSKDPLLLKNLNEGLDMHSILASGSFSIIFDQPVVISKDKTPLTIKGHTIIPNDCREVHKEVTFSKFYKGGADVVYQTLSRYINPVHKAQNRKEVAKKISFAISMALPVLDDYLSDVITKAIKEGYLVTTKLGRRRYFLGKPYGEAANAPIQGACADAMKIALINAAKYLRTIGGWQVLAVHDEDVCLVPERYEEEARLKIQEIVADALTAVLYELKGKAEAKSGDYWAK